MHLEMHTGLFESKEANYVVLNFKLWTPRRFADCLAMWNTFLVMSFKKIEVTRVFMTVAII